MNRIAFGGMSLRGGLVVLVLVLFAPLAWAQSPNVLIEEAMQLMGGKIENRKEELKADRALLYALIDEILLPRFDRRYAARLVLGRNVREAEGGRDNAVTLES